MECFVQATRKASTRAGAQSAGGSEFSISVRMATPRRLEISWQARANVANQSGPASPRSSSEGGLSARWLRGADYTDQQHRV